MNKLIIAVLILVLVGGGWYMYSQNQTELGGEDMGSYVYACDNGSEFTMIPTADMTSIKIAPGTNAAFVATILTEIESEEGARYEGGGIIFVGAGEEVQLTTGGTTLICNPKPNAEMAPWNWGDAGEGAGSVQPDVRLVVGESIMGKWQSTEDAKFVREFKAFSETSLNGQVVDWYDGKQVSSGTYVVFNADHALQVAFPLMENKTYLQLTMQGTQEEKLNFSVNKLTPETLELTYMDRGGVLSFKAIE